MPSRSFSISRLIVSSWQGNCRLANPPLNVKMKRMFDRRRWNRGLQFPPLHTKEVLALVDLMMGKGGMEGEKAARCGFLATFHDRDSYTISPSGPCQLTPRKYNHAFLHNGKITAAGASRYQSPLCSQLLLVRNRCLPVMGRCRRICCALLQMEIGNNETLTTKGSFLPLDWPTCLNDLSCPERPLQMQLEGQRGRGRAPQSVNQAATASVSIFPYSHFPDLVVRSDASTKCNLHHHEISMVANHDSTSFRHSLALPRLS